MTSDRRSDAGLLFLFSLVLLQEHGTGGKIAGKAKKSPATVGPNALAMRAANTEITPPITKRVRCSYHLTCCRTAKLIRIVMMLYRNQAAQRPKAPNIQTSNSATAVGADLECLIPMKYTHDTAYIKNAAAPAIMDLASIAA